MKVLYVAPNAELGGAEKIVELLLRHHDRSVFTPSVVFLNDGGLVQRWRELDVDVRVLSFSRMRRLDLLFRKQVSLGRLLKSERIELVHATMAYGHVFAGPPAALLGVPEVWFQHGPVGGTLDRLAGKIPTRRVLCNSLHTRGRQALFSTHPANVVYGPVELPRADETERAAARASFRERYGIANSDFLIIHVARLDPWKGQAAFIEGFARARRTSTAPLKALVIGGDELGSEAYGLSLRESARALELGSSIQFTGPLRELSPAYFAADLFVHSSRQAEPLGLTILEAMAHGCPVIASASGGPGELFSTGEHALLLPVSDPLSIGNAILELQPDAGGRAKLARAAAERIQELEAKHWTRRIEGIYRELSELRK